MKEIWHPAPLETDLIETRRKKHTINYQQEGSFYYQPTQRIGEEILQNYHTLPYMDVSQK